MKTALLTILGLVIGVPVALFLVWVIWCITGGAIASAITNNHYSQQVSNEWYLSDQASTVDKKLDHLVKFRANLVKAGLDRGQARYIFKNPTTDLANNIDILDTLIQRLTDLQKLNPSSLEYQQALKQITTDEYQGFNTCVFANAWRRKNIGRYLITDPWLPKCQDGQYAGDTGSSN